MNKKPLANCPGCKLLVQKLADDFDIKIAPNELPSLINSVIQEDNEVKQKLSKVRHNYTVLDAEKTKETILLSLEVQQAEEELEKLMQELREELAKPQDED